MPCHMHLPLPVFECLLFRHIPHTDYTLRGPSIFLNLAGLPGVSGSVLDFIVQTQSSAEAEATAKCLIFF